MPSNQEAEASSRAAPLDGGRAGTTPSRPSRRQFVAGLAASVGPLGLAGCLGTGFPPQSSPPPDRTVYVGAYHWGFVVLAEDGNERERLVFDSGTTIRLVAFSTRAAEAISQLPQPVQDGLPDHDVLEERNAGRIPPPPSGTMHDALEEADERYPDHSLAVMPSGSNHVPGGMGGGMGGQMGGGTNGQMGGGMMLHPIPLPHDAPRPTTAGLTASGRGDYTLSCQTYCGYGHPYMDLDGAFVVR